MSVKIAFLKLKAATIFETIVALLILMISFSAGMIICQQVFSRSKSGLELSAAFSGNQLADSLKKVKDYSNRKLMINELEIGLTYRVPTNYPDWYIMELVLYDLNGRRLWTTERLIPQ